jgi:hypothetical protein
MGFISFRMNSYENMGVGLKIATFTALKPKKNGATIGSPRHPSVEIFVL